MPQRDRMGKTSKVKVGLSLISTVPSVHSRCIHTVSGRTATLFTGKMSYVWILLRQILPCGAASSTETLMTFVFHFIWCLWNLVSPWEGDLGPWQRSVFTPLCKMNTFLLIRACSLCLGWGAGPIAFPRGPTLTLDPCQEITLYNDTPMTCSRVPPTHFHSLMHSVTGDKYWYFWSQTIPWEG